MMDLNLLKAVVVLKEVEDEVSRGANNERNASSYVQLIFTSPLGSNYIKLNVHVSNEIFICAIFILN